MPDSAFFKNVGSFNILQLSEIAKAELDDDVDFDFIIEDIAPISIAEKKHITFLDNIKYKQDYLKTKAGVCIVHKDMKNQNKPDGVILLYSDNPYMSYARVASAFYPEKKNSNSISKRASISSSAKIGNNCTIDDGVVIKDNVSIGNDCYIGANVVIAENVKIGANTTIDMNVSLSHALIGDNVRIHTGVRIGQEGFGFASGSSGHMSVPQLGRVIIEDSANIGANTTIDRGSGPDTIIGKGVRIDNLVQIGHNVKIGKYCVIVAQTGISGSTEIDDFTILAGQVGVAGHLKIGKNVRFGAQSGVMRDVPDDAELLGTPAVPIKQFMRQIAAIARLVRPTKRKESN